MALECREKYEQAFETTAHQRELLEVLFAYAYQAGHVEGAKRAVALLVSNPRRLLDGAASDVPRETTTGN